MSLLRLLSQHGEVYVMYSSWTIHEIFMNSLWYKIHEKFMKLVWQIF